MSCECRQSKRKMWRYLFVCVEGAVHADGLRAQGALAEEHSVSIHVYIYLMTRTFPRKVGDDDLQNLYLRLFVCMKPIRENQGPQSSLEILLYLRG